MDRPHARHAAERQDVLGDHREAADEGVFADPAELVDAAESAEVGVVLDDDMPSQRGGVGENGLAPNPAVVADMGIRHEIIIAADFGQPPSFGRPAVDGNVFPEKIAVSDLDLRFVVPIPDILRLASDRRKRRKMAVGADFRPAVDHDMGIQAGVFMDRDMFSDDARWADPHARIQPGLGMDG